MRFSSYIELDESLIKNGDPEDYLNRVREVILKDKEFKEYDVKNLVIDQKGLSINPIKLFKAIYPVINFHKFDTGVSFNFLDFKLVSWHDYDQADQLVRRMHKLIKLYSYCENIARKCW